jgi:hypothetical protein
VETKTEYTGWAAPELVMLFQTRLGPAYDAFVSTLGTMRNLMTDLEDVLCLRSGEVEIALIVPRPYRPLKLTLIGHLGRRRGKSMGLPTQAHTTLLQRSRSSHARLAGDA